MVSSRNEEFVEPIPCSSSTSNQLADEEENRQHQKQKQQAKEDALSENSIGSEHDSTTTTANSKLDQFRWFPSYRSMTAAMLCLCFASVHMMNSNMGMAMVCMVDDSKSIRTYTTPAPTTVSHNVTTANKIIEILVNSTKHFANNEGNTFSVNDSDNTRKQRKHKKHPDHISDSTSTSSTSPPATSTPTTSSKTESAAGALFAKATQYQSFGTPKVNWSAEDQGWIFGAFNAGLLCMLLTGFLADKFNAKYMIIVSVLLASAANFMIPLTAEYDVKYVMGARFLVGLAEALLQPAINSLVTRWFPSSERSYALGLATGGRQIGTLMIVPTAGALCSQTAFFGGWPSIFYISAFTGMIFVAIYIFIGADKPSKQTCISDAELKFITIANTAEDMGKKRMERKVPWRAILSSPPVWSALVSVVCHEFPLMTMIMFLPSYLHDVHHYQATKNGILSAIPTACLWVSKIGSSYLNTWMQEKTTWNTSTISKVLNGVGSVGLALFMVGTTFLDATRAGLAVVFLCFSMLFTGMHTPGCQAALVAVAPAFSGAITGLTFFFVAISGMINPAMTKWIVVTGSQTEWNIVFYISTVIALIPVVVFSVCGSADVQEWAAAPKLSACPTLSTVVDVSSLASAAADAANPSAVAQNPNPEVRNSQPENKNSIPNSSLQFDLPNSLKHSVINSESM